jgi:acetylglutamate kinase
LDENKELFHTFNEEQIDALKEEEIIVGGMIPKAHIIDGRVEHTLLLEILTSEWIGTVIKL